MRKHLKAILRIVIFSSGGLVGVLGMLVILAALAQGPRARGDWIGAMAIGIVLSITGAGVCLLAPKLPKPPAQSRTMSREERIIADLTAQMGRHKQSIIALALLLAMSLVAAVWTWRLNSSLDSMMAPENIDSLIAADPPDYQWPVLFSSLYTLAGAKTKLTFYTFWFAAWTGFLLGCIIIAVVNRTERENTLALWQKIHRLEDEVAELKTGVQRNAQ